MSVTVVNDWRFRDDADMDDAMDAIRAYMSYLQENDDSVVRPVGDVVTNIGTGPGDL